jgi:hypothetical protein
MTEIFDKPWIEKYRPEYLNDVVGKKSHNPGNTEVVSQLRIIAQKGNVPNMILVVIIPPKLRDLQVQAKQPA